MKIKALGKIVMFRRVEEKKYGGLHLPDKAGDKEITLVVLDMGPDCKGVVNRGDKIVVFPMDMIMIRSLKDLDEDIGFVLEENIRAVLQ
jgi:co-chaperonin GroES (HSP10)